MNKDELSDAKEHVGQDFEQLISFVECTIGKAQLKLRMPSGTKEGFISAICAFFDKGQLLREPREGIKAVIKVMSPD